MDMYTEKVAYLRYLETKYEEEAPTLSPMNRQLMREELDDLWLGLHSEVIVVPR